jgi:hypothetical protein
MVAETLIAILVIIAVIIAVIILILLAALYFLPITIGMYADKTGESFLMTMLASWAIFGVKVYAVGAPRSMDVLVLGFPVMRRDLTQQPEEKEVKPEKEEEKKERPGISTYLDAATELWPYLMRVISAFLRSLSLKKLYGAITLGLSDPSQTGMLYGYFNAFRYSIWALEPVDFLMTPVFNREIFEGQMEMEIRINRPLLILLPMVSALAKRPVRQKLRQIAGS